MPSSPIILTTTNFSTLFSEIYSVVHPGAGENNSNIGKVLQIGNDGRVTFTNDIVTGTGLSALEARVTNNETALANKANTKDVTNAITSAKTELSAVNANSGLANVLGFAKGTNTNLVAADGTTLNGVSVTTIKEYIDANNDELSKKMGSAPSTTVALNALKTNLGITATGTVNIWQAIEAIADKIGSSTAVKPSDLGMSITYN